MSDPLPPMLALLQAGIAAGGFQTDDVLATILPLFRQTLAAHEAGFVAPLEQIDSIEVTDEKRLMFSEAVRERPRRNNSALAKVQEGGPKAVKILGSMEHS